MGKNEGMKAGMRKWINKKSKKRINEEAERKGMREGRKSGQNEWINQRRGIGIYRLN